jgi:hypothetical protein
MSAGILIAGPRFCSRLGLLARRPLRIAQRLRKVAGSDIRLMLVRRRLTS